MLQHSDDPAITRWRYREPKGQIRQYLWLEALDYVVVLEERNMLRWPVLFLITAYHVDGESSRRQLRKKYERREV